MLLPRFTDDEKLARTPRKGHGSVHTRFTVAQIANVRVAYPGVRVIVHPEVPLDVVQAADDSGSTEYRTETHLNRLARRFGDRKYWTKMALDRMLSIS